MPILLGPAHEKPAASAPPAEQALAPVANPEPSWLGCLARTCRTIRVHGTQTRLPLAAIIIARMRIIRSISNYTISSILSVTGSIIISIIIRIIINNIIITTTTIITTIKRR